ncbi:MAG TPA: rhodanese-like domain-containing protein [Campylobacterales bacterium]|nr:rhodanese-like domain-containing protein [Campylobacterales bacterium]HHD80281.1 rhodanese-like domain-containing protein [Campylobacterales bacterium]
MKKTLLGVLLLGSSLFAEVTNVTVTPKFVNSTKLKIIDIRTKSEWRETGVVKDSYPLTFFNEKGNYDIDGFLNSLNKIVKKDEKFALICRTGSRTGMVSNFLGNKLNYHVVNLKGGIMKLMREGYKAVPYKSKN